jgi:hypothetical protein
MRESMLRARHSMSSRCDFFAVNLNHETALAETVPLRVALGISSRALAAVVLVVGALISG